MLEERSEDLSAQIKKAAVQEKGCLIAIEEKSKNDVQQMSVGGADKQKVLVHVWKLQLFFFIFKKAEPLIFQVTINFQKSFTSKHYQSNLPFISDFRVSVKLICVFNFKGKIYFSGWEIPGLGLLSLSPFLSHSLSSHPLIYAKKGLKGGSQDNHFYLLFFSINDAM